jgi:hypothetical protein
MQRWNLLIGTLLERQDSTTLLRKRRKENIISGDTIVRNFREYRFSLAMVSIIKEL